MYKKEEMEITYNLTHSENSQLTFYYISIWFCFWGVVYNFDINYTLLHVFCNPPFHLLYGHVFVSVSALFQRHFRCGPPLF